MERLRGRGDDLAPWLCPIPSPRQSQSSHFARQRRWALAVRASCSHSEGDCFGPPINGSIPSGIQRCRPAAIRLGLSSSNASASASAPVSAAASLRAASRAVRPSAASSGGRCRSAYASHPSSRQLSFASLAKRFKFCRSASESGVKRRLAIGLRKILPQPSTTRPGVEVLGPSLWREIWHFRQARRKGCSSRPGSSDVQGASAGSEKTG
jgi:hypothetical protein